MRIVRTGAVLVAAGLLGSALAACSSGDGDAAPTTTTTPTPVATATTDAPVRDPEADLVIWCSADRVPTVQKYANEFGQENGITVAVQAASNPRQQFKDATVEGKGPDIVLGAHDWMGELVSNDTLAPIPLSPDLTGQFLKSAVAATRYGGQTYGVPFAVESLGLVRNTAMAPKAPASMDALIAMAKAAMKRDKSITSVLSQPVGKTGNAYYTYPYLTAYGGGIFATKKNGEYDPSKVIVGSEGSIKGGEELARLGKLKVLSTNIDDTNADALFRNRKTPFMITGPWGTPSIEKAKIAYAVSPLPTLPDGGAMQPFLGVQLFYISAKAKNATFAQEFVTNYVTRKDVQVAFYRALGRPPALKSALQEVAAGDPEIAAWIKAGAKAQPMPNIPEMNSVWGPLGQAGSDVVAQKAVPAKRFVQAQAEIEKNIK